MKTNTIKFAYDGESQTAIVEEINVDSELQYQVTPSSKKLEEKFGKTVFCSEKR